MRINHGRENVKRSGGGRRKTQERKTKKGNKMRTEEII